MSLSLLKGRLRALRILAAVAFVLWYTGNLWIEKKLPYIEAAIGRSLGHPVTVERARYDPLRGFVLEGVEVKQISPQLSAYRARRLWLTPEIHLFPGPAVWIRKLIVDGPEVRFQAGVEEVFGAAASFQDSLEFEYPVGRVRLGLRLRSMEVRNGKLTLLSPVSGKVWRQDFENVRFFSGDRWFRKKCVELGGNIAGRPNATFRMRLETRQTPGGLPPNSSLTVDLHEFTTAYIGPHLRDRLRLPDRDLTAAIRIDRAGRSGLRVRGTVRMPEIASQTPSWVEWLRRSDDVRFMLDGTWRDGVGLFDTVKLQVKDVEFSGTSTFRLAREDAQYELSLEASHVPLALFQERLPILNATGGFVRLRLALRGDAKAFDPNLEAEFQNCSLRIGTDGVVLSKLAGRVGWAGSRIYARDLWAFVNDTPFALDGEYRWGRKESFRLSISTYPGQIEPLRLANPRVIKVRAKGIRSERGWSGILRMEDPKSVMVSFHGSIPPPFVFTDWTRALRTGMLWRTRAIRWREADRETDLTDKDIVIEHPILFLKKTEMDLEVELMNGRWREGRLVGRAKLHPDTLRWEADARLNGGSMRKILQDLRCHLPLSGLLSADAAWRGLRAESCMEIRFKLIDGVVSPDESVRRFSVEAGIPDLSHFRFKRFSGEIRFEKGVWDLNDLVLDADQAHLTAQLKARKRRLTGDMHIRFPASMVSPVSDLKWLMDFVNVGRWVDLDLKVTSNYRTARVEWLSGEFRRKIEARLVPWMRAELERQILGRIGESTKVSKPNILDNPNAKAYAERNLVT